jgi:ATP-dependent DNA ligase
MKASPGKAVRTDLTDTVGHLGGPLRPGNATPSPAWAPLRLSHETSQSLENDGWRLAAFRRRQRVVLQSRSSRDLCRYFPDVAATAANLAPGTVVDARW